MAKKQDPIMQTAETLQSLFIDPIGNYDAITDVLQEQRNLLVAILDNAQTSLDWLAALGIALQRNKVEALVKKANKQ